VSLADICSRSGRVIAGATDLPVHSDLENGYPMIRSKLPRACAMRPDAGIVCGSIR